MSKLKKWVALGWTGILFWLVALGAVSFVLWFNLGGLVPGVSSSELATATKSSAVEKLIDNPIGLPHKLLQYSAQRIDVSPTTIRLSSTIFGLLAIGCFYYILRSWYSRRVAVLGTMLFATSPWLLHIARSGTTSAMYLLLFGTVACTVWMQNSKGSFWSVAAGVLLILMLLYTPGMIWFVVPALLWQVGRISSTLEGQNAGILTIVSLLLVVALAPIGWALYKEPSLAKTYFGLPQTVPKVTEILGNVASVPTQLFFRGPDNPEMWLGRLPLLGWFVGVMFFIGLYAFFHARRLDRAAFMLFVLVFGTVLIGAGGPVTIDIILPFVYLVAASGIALMLQQWFTVFPRNPFARSTGAILMTAVVLLATYANVMHYFVAWPNTPETKRAYNRRL